MLLLGALCWVLALAVLFFVVTRSSAPKLPEERRRPPSEAPASTLSKLTGRTTTEIDGVLDRNGWTRGLAARLEAAGIKSAPADFLVLVGTATVVGALFGLLLAGPGLALLVALVAPVGAKLLLSVRTTRRQKAFGDQLDDTLQLLAGGLRAGHSLLRAIDAVSHEAASPTAEEFARAVNETRLGRDLNDALDQTAARMKSEDFSWIAQAIGIHREVGGDLGSVLDQVGATIRERNQIRRQVASLSAEGKMSAYVLMALPVVVVAILTLTSPSYVGRFLESVYGFGLIGLMVVMMTIGGLWMRKVVTFKF